MHPKFFLYVVYGEVYTWQTLCKSVLTYSRECLYSILGPLLLAHKNIGMLTKGRHNTKVHRGITLFLAEKLDKLVDLTNALLCEWRSFHHSFCGTLPLLGKWNKTPFLQTRFSLF